MCTPREDVLSKAVSEVSRLDTGALKAGNNLSSTEFDEEESGGEHVRARFLCGRARQAECTRVTSNAARFRAC